MNTTTTKIIQKEYLHSEEFYLDDRDISSVSQQEKFLNGVRRRLYVAKYLMEDASQHIKTTMVSVKYPKQSSYLKRYIQLKQHLLCIFETETSSHTNPDEMISLSKFFLKRHKSTMIKVTANNCSFDILFQSRETCSAWWNILLRTKRYLQLQEEEARMMNQLNETFEMFTINVNREQAACRIQATWRAFQSRKLGHRFEDRLKLLNQALKYVYVGGFNGTETNKKNTVVQKASSIFRRQHRTYFNCKSKSEGSNSRRHRYSRVKNPSFFELASPVVLPENMRSRLEQSIIREVGEYWVDVVIVETLKII
ncbi:Disheveled-associated activator of morphogenesis 1 [Galdieria sulphuraria]|nr:Disheveled-associated activator of morphogenesis 1 [Galdieria sulphuraria]